MLKIKEREELYNIKVLKINLEKVRKEKRLTQKELARLSGVAQSTISAIENNAVSPKLITASKLAAALQIDPLSYIYEIEMLL
ncbi:helix-turn-helix transcriptional regulator [Clostridium sp. ZS2]|uniref:helix-turn-helix domain-containing protein n=1 Tax=Clostridium sp. ZS2 TaxID=2949988 RepID=UPI00207950D7|nr:helix-turn-helix transcriptional regulator [Clostridium sp. ZS2]